MFLEAKRLAFAARNLDCDLSVVLRVPSAVYVWLDTGAGWDFGYQHSAEHFGVCYLLCRIYERDYCRYISYYRIPFRGVLIATVSLIRQDFVPRTEPYPDIASRSPYGV